jgi:pyruvate/2-oxoglutarate dehydrogenase complex dihydrolipoamide dehydrogenase (E3) component
MSEREFDVIVVGAGPAGEVLAGRTAAAGLETAIVEPELIGGECSYWACMPSKALLRPGELMAETRRVPGVREAVTGTIDAQAALARRDEVIHDLDDSGQVEWLDGNGIELVRAHGRVDGERRVQAGDDVLTARKAVVLATGSASLLPPIDGLADAKPWTNREATNAKEAPARLAILGGGVVGVEMSQAWQSLGSQVILIEAAEFPLEREDDFAGQLVQEALEAEGVEVRCDTKATAVHRNDDDSVTIEVEGQDPVTADELIVAVGRHPHTDDLGVDSVGLEPGKYIEVDDQMRVQGVDGDWLYAVGDVNGRVLLTHMGKYQARVATDVILGGDARATWDGPISPRVVFTDPQVAAVGHTSQTAEKAGLNIRVVDRELSMNAGASFYGKDTPGTVRMVVDEDRKVIVGMTFVGFEVLDFLHAATIAVVGEVPLDTLWHAVPSFPTRSEVWLNLFEEYGF